MLKHTWGENVIGQVGISLVFGVVFVAMGLLGTGLIFASVASGSAALIVAVSVALGIAFLLALLVQSALAGVYSAALFRYADKGDASIGFDNSVLQSAFAPKA